MARLLASVFLLLAVACSETGAGEGGSAPAPVATPPGRAEVYERIAALTDCAALQREFDQAETNGRAARARGDLDLSRISTSYMEAADKRMREAGCYR